MNIARDRGEMARQGSGIHSKGDFLVLSRSIDRVCHTKLSWHYNAIKVGLACGQLQPGTTLISRNIWLQDINRNMKSTKMWIVMINKLGWIDLFKFLLLILHTNNLHFYLDDNGIFCKCSWQLRIFNPSFPLVGT